MKNFEFKVFMGFLLGLLIVPVFSYQILRPFFQESTIPGVIAIGMVIAFKLGYVIFVMMDKNNFTDKKRNNKLK